MKNLMTRAQALKYGATVAFLTAAGAANAAAIDVTEVVADIKAQAGPVGLIGSAILLIVVGIVAFKWVRRALA